MTAGATDAAVGPPPPFDQECAVALDVVPPWLARSVTPQTIEARRAGERAAPPVEGAALRRGGRFTVEERRIPGPAGAPAVVVLVCRPTWVAAPTTAVLHLHGGGMIGGGTRTTIAEPLDWAEHLGATVVSVDYRLAPEHPYPAQVEDCYAALLWLGGQAPSLGVDPRRIVVAGVSAGGGLAAALALLTRDRDGPSLAGQMLLCPMLDDRNDTVSAHQMAGTGIWDRTSNQTGWDALLGAARGGLEVAPYAAPARATDLTGLPPAYLDVGSAETFRDETVAYASRLWQAGGIAELHVWPGGFHGYPGLAPTARISQETVAARLRWLRRLLDQEAL